MNKKHLKIELDFYNKAFANNSLRRNNNYGWEYVPSKSVMELVLKNKIAKDARSKRMLDLGCGDGRHIAYFRKLGFEVWGVDFSEESIAFCEKRFDGDKKVHLEIMDLTEKDISSKLGEFDVVLDWSVLDHMRKQYVKKYLRNVLRSIKKKGYAIFSEFDDSLPGVFANKNYKSVGGHYSRAYSFSELKSILRPLRLVDKKEKVLEDMVNKYKFNTLLMKK